MALLFTTEPDGRAPAVDLATAATIASFRGCSTSSHGVTPVGPHHFAATQRHSRTVHVYAYHKDSVVTRSFTSEPLTALVGSPCGTFLVGGGASGSIQVWEVATGRVLRQYPGHYKAVTALVFSPDSSLLISGGADAAVHVWALVEVLGREDDSDVGVGHVRPRESYDHHTMPVTGLVTGMGVAGLGLLVTCGADAQVRPSDTYNNADHHRHVHCHVRCPGGQHLVLPGDVARAPWHRSGGWSSSRG